ncbi:MAG: hypothetical protein KC468_23280, partial [Myxococcales bacterium]|nr:hypothetical protein [Myxococcales bacterium]
RMLWSDEGIFTMTEARERFARTALQGWSPDEGFFDLLAVLRFFWARHSLFFFWDSPSFVEWYMFAFFAVLLLYALGVFSRTTGVIAFLMMCGVYNRNSLYLEGTDTVYCVFWFLLLFCKTGHAWSFDNWWRCRRLRRRGRLAEVGSRGPPEADDGADERDGRAARRDPELQPVYRLAPSWPRYLMMAQLVALYTTTGLEKTGSVWARGDALYYALNMDHFYRFEPWTQIVSSMTATTVFRVMTWVTHWWEMCFAVVGLGLIFKFRLDHKDERWYRQQLKNPVKRWTGRIALVAAYVALYLIVVKSIPYCIPEAEGGDTVLRARRVAYKLHNFRLVYGAYMPAVIAAYVALGRWPIQVFRARGRRLGRWRVSLPGWRLDQRWLRDWFTGRRVWLTLGVFFHGTLILFMNIGMFPFIMLMTYAAWFSGEEFTRVFTRVGDWARRTRLARWLPARRPWLAPAQHPEDAPVRGRRIPDGVVLVLGLLAVGLVLVRVYDKVPEGADMQDLVELWTIITLGTGLVFVAARWRRRRPYRGELGGGPALAYTAFGRTLALLFVLWHGGSVVMTLFPSYTVFSSWRSPARTFFSGWSQGTSTTQSWKMFAPNPPRSNSFMKTVVVDEDGWRWDLQNNSFDLRPNPWIWNDRMRKMQRRMIGKGKWYLKYWAAFQCREWYLYTGGRSRAERIEVVKLYTTIPTPEQVTKQGWYNPRKLKVKTSVVQSHKCPDGGDLPVFMKERYGYPISAEDRARAEKEAERAARSFKNRRTTWENRRHFFGKQDKVRSRARTTTSESTRRTAPARRPGAAAYVPAGDDE